MAAGNNGTGTGPVTLYPPANDPFAITVGAADSMGTIAMSDDTVAAFSAYGTTENGFAKPDLIAPGRNIVSLLSGTDATSYVNHRTHRIDNSVFRMSGTSMATPMVTGAIALLLQDEPTLTPDQVKYRLTATANKSWSGYDASKAGAGYLDVYAAINGTTTQSANTNIAASQMLFGGTKPVVWNSVNWNSVNWNSVNWNSVNWNSVNWNSTIWSSVIWDEEPVRASAILDEFTMTSDMRNRSEQPYGWQLHEVEDSPIMTDPIDSETPISETPTLTTTETVQNTSIFLPLVTR